MGQTTRNNLLMCGYINFVLMKREIVKGILLFSSARSQADILELKSVHSKEQQIKTSVLVAIPFSIKTKTSWNKHTIIRG